MIIQNNHEAQMESGVNTLEENITSNNVNNAAKVDSCHVDIHKLENCFVGKVRNELDNLMATADTRF